MTPTDTTHDVLIIGGGPAGSCAALYLARRGIRSCIVEKDTFPRFHVGESLIPSVNPMLDELGLTGPLSQLPTVPKHGAEIALAWQETGTRLFFRQGRPWCETSTFNVERATFDQTLLDHAAAHDLIEVRHGVSVTGIDRLRDNDCRVQTSDGVMSARLVLDCSGQGTVLGRLLNCKHVLADHRKVAFMGHFTGVDRLPGEASGFISLVLADDAWFWCIPIDERRTSIGMVMDKSSIGAMRQQGVERGQELAWALPRTPCLAQRMTRAESPESNGVVGDFSYHCDPGAGDGYLMVGDAQAFLDPVFSTGVHLAIAGARDAAEAAHDILHGGDAATARRRYLERGTARKTFFFHYINRYYTHAFREVLVVGRGPLGLHRALIAVLAGRCERLPWAMRWRLAVLDQLHRLQHRWGKAVPQRQGWSVLRNQRTDRTQALHTLQSAPRVTGDTARPAGMSAPSRTP